MLLESDVCMLLGTLQLLSVKVDKLLLCQLLAFFSPFCCVHLLVLVQANLCSISFGRKSTKDSWGYPEYP
jgi:hypothetical protein